MLEGVQLVALPLLYNEVANTLLQKIKQRKLPEAEAMRQMRRFVTFNIEYINLPEFHPRSIQIALQVDHPRRLRPLLPRPRRAPGVRVLARRQEVLRPRPPRRLPRPLLPRTPREPPGPLKGESPPKIPSPPKGGEGRLARSAKLGEGDCDTSPLRPPPPAPKLPPMRYSKEMMRRAREMRLQPTDTERLLWRMLRNYAMSGGVRFRRQHPPRPLHRRLRLPRSPPRRRGRRPTPRRRVRPPPRRMARIAGLPRPPRLKQRSPAQPRRRPRRNPPRARTPQPLGWVPPKSPPPRRGRGMLGAKRQAG